MKTYKQYMRDAVEAEGFESWADAACKGAVELIMKTTGKFLNEKEAREARDLLENGIYDAFVSTFGTQPEDYEFDK